MSNRDRSPSAGSTPEEKQLLIRARDLAERAERQYCACFTPFLTPAEQALLQRVYGCSQDVALSFQGGYPEAERKMAVFTPVEFYGEIPLPIDVLALEHKGDPLGHRDILGALMALGIKRDRIGDILDGCQPQLVLCDSTLTDYIISELKKAGRTSLEVRRGEITAPAEADYTEQTGTVASLRLDSIVAEGFRISRTKAAEQIKRGLVQLNWMPCEDCSRKIKAGDRISLRGSGKIELVDTGKQSRKGRTFITIRRY